MQRAVIIKYGIPLLILAVISVSFLNGYKENYTLKVKVIKSFPYNDSALLHISSSITNNTKDTLKYVNLTCDWHVIYITNNKKVIILLPHSGCDANYPKIYTIAPDETVKRDFKIGITDRIKGIPIKFNIGIALISPENFHIIDSLRSNIKSLKHQTLWSNTLEF